MLAGLLTLLFELPSRQFNVAVVFVRSFAKGEQHYSTG
jgi:hypothetical protein